jgi:hypothetical protein
MSFPDALVFLKLGYSIRRKKWRKWLTPTTFPNAIIAGYSLLEEDWQFDWDPALQVESEEP